MRRALLVCSIALVGALAQSALGPTAATAASSARPRPSRVLVVSLPTLSWDDFKAHHMPNLARLLRTSAVGDLTTRGVASGRSLGDGYATVGAGTRAAGVPDVDGFGFGVDERFGSQSVSTVYRLRTGRDAKSGLVDLSLADVVNRNDSLLYDARIGALGDALARAGYERAVIANADGGAPLTTSGSYRRQAVMSLMDRYGHVPAGRVDAGLLQADPQAPFGVRLDEQAVTAAFDAAWQPRSVVLVEASDLARQDQLQRSVLSTERDPLLRRAMDATDRLVGALLARVDLTRDIVMVVGPAASSTRSGLTIAALHTPETHGGWLRSGTTRRARFVQLVDVAPTILDQLGIVRPDTMEGRPFEVAASGASVASRAASLADVEHAARFRDGQTTLAAPVYSWVTVLLVVAAVVVIGLGRRGRGALAIAALAMLAFLPLTYLATLIPFDDLGTGPYWLFLVGGSLVVALGLASLRKHALTPLMGALGLVFALLTVDMVVGSRLQLNAVFGYSPIQAGRFAGMGNLAYSMYSVAAFVLAGLVAHRVRPPLGRRLAIGIVVVALLVDGLPFWGSDVGGVLSLVPAVGIFGMVLFGVRVRMRVLLGWIGGAVAAFVAVGLLDLTRPADRRTHLGRLFEKIGAGDFGGFATVIDRKLHENLSALTSIWVVLVPFTFALLLWLAFVRPGHLRALRSEVPELVAVGAGLVVLVPLGFALNDSGIAIPGMMFGVVDAALVYLLARTPAVETDPTAAELEALTAPARLEPASGRAQRSSP